MNKETTTDNEKKGIVDNEFQFFIQVKKPETQIKLGRKELLVKTNNTCNNCPLVVIEYKRLFIRYSFLIDKNFSSSSLIPVDSIYCIDLSPSVTEHIFTDERLFSNFSDDDIEKAFHLFNEEFKSPSNYIDVASGSFADKFKRAQKKFFIQEPQAQIAFFQKEDKVESQPDIYIHFPQMMIETCIDLNVKSIVSSNGLELSFTCTNSFYMAGKLKLNINRDFQNFLSVALNEKDMKKLFTDFSLDDVITALREYVRYIKNFYLEKLPEIQKKEKKLIKQKKMKNFDEKIIL